MGHISVPFVAPARGVVLDAEPGSVPQDAAKVLENLRVDGSYVRSRAGSSTLLNVPDTKRVVDLFNIAFADRSVESIRCDRAQTYRQDGSVTPNVWTAIGAATWTGADSDRFAVLRAPWTGEPKGRIILCNGIDGPKSWTGAAAAASAIGGASVPFKFAVVGFDNRLFVLATTEAGSLRTQRVRWTVVGDASNWSGTGSGFLDLFDDAYEGTALWKQAGRIYVGKTKALCVLVPSGIATDAYSYETVQTDGDGVFCPRSLAQFGEIVAFISHTGFKSFDSASIVPLGDGRVSKALLDRLNYSALDQVTSLIDAARGRVGWGLPLDGAVVPSELWWYSFRTDSWEVDILPHSALSLYTNIDVTTIDELVGTIDAQTSTIDQLSAAAQAKAQIMVGFNDGKTRLIDDTVSADVGTGFTATYVTGNLPCVGREIEVAPGQVRTIMDDDVLVLDRVALRLLDRGSTYTLTIEASGDGGATWQSVGGLTLTTGASESLRRSVEKFVTCRLTLGDSVQIRVRNSTLSVPFGWTSGNVHVKLGGKKRP